ncbi:MAG: helix-turn-helix transcriptional regulator [Patescibacteria group bacterium]|nr:helix-turn-helix transcriptional regulator [Patescibacteria group bacterium]
MELSTTILEVAMKLSQRLKELRKAKGLTLQDVARRCECSFQYISQLENDMAFRPKLELLYKLAAYYDFSSDTLILEAGKIPQDVYWLVINNPSLLNVIRSYKE